MHRLSNNEPFDQDNNDKQSLPLIKEGEKLFENLDFAQAQESAVLHNQGHGEVLVNKPEEIVIPQSGDSPNNPQTGMNEHPLTNPVQFLRPRMNLMQKLNMFVYNNYLLLIIIIFAGIFIMVPAVLLSKRDFTKSPRLRVQIDDIIKPFADKKNYRYLRLSNFMNVLLVSDPEMIGAGAALQSNIGSSFEPKEIPGLAHFLEHMLFMGSHKYPEENAFKDFLSQHGGNCNAYTNDESTTFYFALGADGLEKALDMFSRFFIDPLFKSDMVEREVSAINSEYENNLQSNSWRWLELIRMLSNPHHPFHRFTIGNARTLKEIPSTVNLNVRRELIKFFRNYYSPEHMNLVIMGNRDLNSLERLAVEKFSQIPYNKNWKKPLHMKNIPDAFPADKLGKFVWYKPVGKQKIFSIIFPLKGSQEVFSSKSMDYLSALIGYEGKKSLKSFLSQKGWLSAINVGAVRKTSDFQIFYVDFTLTDSGMRNIIEVAESFFAFLKIIKKKGLSLDIFKRFGLTSYLNFMYKERGGLQNDLISLVGRLGSLSLDELLISPEVFLSYNESKIEKHLEEFRVENSIFIIGTAEVEKDRILEKINFKSSIEKVLPVKNSTGKRADASTNQHFLESSYETNFTNYKREFEEEITSAFYEITKELSAKKGLDKITAPINPFTKASLNLSTNARKTQRLFRLAEKRKGIFSKDEDEDDFSEESQENPGDEGDSKDGMSEASKPASAPERENKAASGLPTNNTEEQNISPYKRLDKYYDIMKIYYAVESMNESFVKKINAINESAYEAHLSIPSDDNKYIPETLDLETNCLITPNDLNEQTGNDLFISAPSNSSSLKSQLKPKAKPNVQDDVGQLRRKIRKSNTTSLFNDLIETFYDNPKANKQQSISKSCFYKEVNRDLNEDYPNLLLNSSKTEFWVKSDRSYLSPKSILSVSLGSNSSYKTARRALMTNLLTDHLQMSLSEELYDAQLVGYDVKMKNNDKGIEFLFGGFSDKMPLLAKQVLMGLKNLKLEEKFLALIKESHSRNYENFDQMAPSEQCERIMNKVLRKYYYFEKDLKKELANITLQDLHAYHQELLASLTVKGLIVGNIRNNSASALSHEISSIFSNENSSQAERTNHESESHVLKLPSDRDLVLRIVNKNPEDQNNALINYYQSGPRTMANLVMQIFFSGPLRNEAFSYLRTKNQLGYLVYSVNYPVHNIDGWILVLQGSKKTPDEMDGYVDKFLEEMMIFFRGKSEEVYHEARNGFVAALFSRDGSLGQRSAKYWEEILTSEYRFNRAQELAAAARKLKKADFLAFFEGMFGKTRRKLSVQMFSGSSSEDNRSRLLTARTLASVQNSTREQTILLDLESFQEMERYPDE